MIDRQPPPAWPHLALAGYLLVCAGFLIWPGYAWIGVRIEPFVLGLPFSLFWIVAWVVLTCLVLCAYYLATEPRRTD